jgi:hypothetical protein
MSETLDTAVRIACGVSIPIAISIVIVPKVAKSYSLSSWSRTVLWISSFAMLVSAAFGIIQAPMPYSSRLGVVSFAVFLFFGGLAFGGLLTLVLSGALSKKDRDDVA